MTSRSGWQRKSITDADRKRKREYNSKRHKDARALFALRVESGAAQCWRCQRWIPPGSRWHVGHDEAWTRIEGPEHAKCNLNAAASKGARIANARRKTGIVRERERPLRTTRRW